MAMVSRWKSFLAMLQIKSSLIDGLKIVLPIAAIWALYSFVGGGLSKLWSNVFAIAGEKQYFPSHGTGILLTLLLIYLAGRAPRTQFFMLTVGRLLVKIPRIEVWYKGTVVRMFTKSGFLTPVWVYHNALIGFDRRGRIDKISYGRRRRAYFLREVSDTNPELPATLQRVCEVMMATPSIVGGIVELFPFPLVAVQIAPDSEAFGWALMTSGIKGYQDMQTISWDRARLNNGITEIPEKKRKVLEKLGIAIPAQQFTEDTR